VDLAIERREKVIRSSLTGKVTLAAMIIVVLIIGAVAGTSWVVNGIRHSIEHLADHTIKRMTHADAASNYLSRAFAEAYAAGASGSRAKIAVARLYLAAARNELSRLSDPETHDIADEILVEQEIIVQHYIRLADEAETTLLSLENAIIENDQEAISGYNAAMIALVIQSGQLADAMSSLGLKEFRETEEMLRSEIRTAHLVLSSASVVLVLTAVMALFLLRRHIVHPIEQLAEAAHTMSERRSVAPLRITSRDEIGRLQRAFNEMTEALAQQTRRLEEQITISEAARAGAEIARMHLQEQLATIEEQREVIRSMSVPLLPLTRTSAVVPLIGAIDSARLAILSNRVLQSVADRRFRYILFDITGVPLVDKEVAQGLLSIVHALRLPGAEAVLVGIRPEVAQALAPPGNALAEVTTYSSLEQVMIKVLNGYAR
jgi:anti-anti-sigma regulatory factor/HAMP domain-containing protein